MEGRLATGGPLAIVLLDIDRFKAVNDEQGHEAGDRLLRAFAECVRAEIERGSVFARLGGEEFCIIPPERPARSSQALAETIRARFEQDGARHAGVRGNATVSIGIAEGQCNEEGLRATMKSADDALYEAKGAGRNRVAVSG
jgi:diguanylate cyclase (GGDEF)-like protein